MNKLGLYLAALICAVTARGETVEISPIQDLTVYEAEPNSSLANDQVLGISNVAGKRSRTLLRYDIGAAVPAGATVTSAGLRLSVLNASAPRGSSPIFLHRLNPILNEGPGSATGEATWNCRVHPGLRWARGGAAAGIDFARRASALGETSADGITFGSSATLVRDVQGWLDVPYSNDGWILLMRDDAPQGETLIASREVPGSAPTLTIEFTPAATDLDSPAAQYEATFQATWTAASHPREFPGGAHWSGLVGGLHNHLVSFWTRGLAASEGIRRMAEVGNQSTLLGEVNNAVLAGTANRPLSGPGIGAGSGYASIQFTVDRTHPLVTLTSMVAPSPDWFVGVRSLPLMERGRWVPLKIVPLYPYDAGTDSGVTFASANLVTEPRGVVTRILTPPLAKRSGYVRPMGKMLFRRLDAPPQQLSR